MSDLSQVAPGLMPPDPVPGRSVGTGLMFSAWFGDIPMMERWSRAAPT
jgi:hypothetical protein